MPSAAAGTVLLVANYPSDVGYAWWLMENFWAVIAEDAALRGCRCLLVYPKVAAIPEAVATAPLEIVEQPFSVTRRADVRRGLEFICRHNVRSIYLTDWPYLHWAYGLWRLAGVRRIVIHDHTPGDGVRMTPARACVKGALHRLRLVSATTYVGVSEYIARRMQVSGCVPAARCVVVTNGIRPFECSTAARAAMRRQLDIPADAVLIVLVSRATAYKGLDFAVRCIAKLLESPQMRDRVYGVHCGEGPDLQRIVALAQAAAVESRFRLLGRRSDVRDILCAADIAFHPSRGEAMSLAILEFMCAELAVVVPDLPSVSTAIRHGVDGLTYEAGDVDSATAALRELVEQPARRQALGREAGLACRKTYSLDATNREFRGKVLPAL